MSLVSAVRQSLKEFTMSSLHKLLSLLLIMTLFSCSPKGFNSTSSTDDGTNTGQGNKESNNIDDRIPDGTENPGGGGSGGGNTNQPTKTSPEIDGLIQSNQAESRNKLAYTLDKETKEIVVSAPLPLGVQISSAGTIKEIPGLRYGTEIDANNKPLFVVRIPARHIVEGIKGLTKGKLPNGNYLPLMPTGFGELPSAQAPLKIGNKNFNMHIYIEKRALAVLIEVPSLNVIVDYTSSIRSKDKSTILGYFGLLAGSSRSNPGLFISFLPNKSLTSQIEEFLKD